MILVAYFSECDNEMSTAGLSSVCQIFLLVSSAERVLQRDERGDEEEAAGRRRRRGLPSARGAVRFGAQTGQFVRLQQVRLPAACVPVYKQPNIIREDKHQTPKQQM